MNAQFSDYLVTLFNAGLVLVLGIIAKPIFEHLKKVLEKVDSINDDLYKAEKRFRDIVEREVKPEIRQAVHKIHTSGEDLSGRIRYIQRALEDRTLELREREVDLERLEDQFQKVDGELRASKSFDKKSLEIHKGNRRELDRQRSELKRITDDLLMIKKKGLFDE